MGAFCCCPCADDFEEYQNNSIYTHCLSLRFFFHQLFSGYSTIFLRIEGRSVSSSIQGTTLASSGMGTVLPDSSLNDAHHSVSRPLPYDADQRFSRSQRDGLVSRRDKSMTHFQEDSQPLRRNMSSSGTEPLGSGKKWNGVDSAEEFKLGHSEKALTTKVAHGLIYIQPSSEDEDVCPTCLDEYTPENPKITAKCSHHFHLGCIYEWMERSDSCPICGKGDLHAFRGYGTISAREWYMELPDAVRHIVDEASFGAFCIGLTRLITSRPLLGALVERWWDTTDSLHFSTAGEMTMTPFDFSMCQF